MRQRGLETVRRLAPHLPGVTPGATGTAGHPTARRQLRSAAVPGAHDGTGRVALPHPVEAHPVELDPVVDRRS